MSVATKKQERAHDIAVRLKQMYPKAKCSLDFTNAFELLIATMLSAQSTDARVNIVTKSLFRKYPGPAEFARTSQAEMEHDVKQTGFYRNKAKAVIAASKAIVEQHGGDVPSTMDELTALPGVGRKTANVIRGNAFGAEAGMVVDTHVGRLSRRLGLTRETDPVKVETALNLLVPPKDRAVLAHRLIQHGRRVCTARRAFCERCVLSDVCPKIGVSLVPRAGAPRTGKRRSRR